MGLDRHSIAFLVAARRLGVSYEATLQLGRQSLPSNVNVAAAFRDAGARLPPGGQEPILGSGYADALIERIGGRDVESLDAAGWEGATHVHDLNKPLPAKLRYRYSAVLDGGTLEHVFDYPTALRGALDAVRLGGHFIAVTPTNGWCGHGFYQLSPELFFVAMGPASGFAVRCVLIRTQRIGARFYAVADPAALRRRVPLRSAWPCLLYVIAQRVQEVDLASLRPQQSDYTAAWQRGQVGSPASSRLRRYVPHALQEPLVELRSTLWSLTRFAAVCNDFQAVRLDRLGDP